MSKSGLVQMQIRDVAVVNFRNTSILDGNAVEDIRTELYSLIEDKAARKVVLDFTPVQFLSSMMLGVLLDLNKKSAAIKGRIVICGLRPKLFEVFKVMRLDKMMNFAPDEEAALGQFGVSGKT